MTTESVNIPNEPSLEILGISEAEERIYRWLLVNPHATAQEIAQALSLSPRKTKRLLDTIELKGLATYTPERPRHYIPTPPDIAIESLVLQRHQAVQRALGLVPELQKQAKRLQKDQPEQMLELIASHTGERQALQRLHQTAQHEIVTLIRSPVMISRLDVPHEQDHRLQSEALRRGVRYRNIVEREFLALPDVLHRIQKDIKAGEETRVISHLPFKLVISDQRIGIVPLVLGAPADHIVLLARASPLLDALYALFEMLWERAVPIAFHPSGKPKIVEHSSRISHDFADLIPLMAAGLNDKKAAREMGVSLRTFYRRVDNLMKDMDAQTRFQFGWNVAWRSFDSKAKGVEP